jgi:putative DNA primase/helicase
LEKSRLAISVSEWGVTCFRDRSHSRSWDRLTLGPIPVTNTPSKVKRSKSPATMLDERAVALLAREAAAYEWTFAMPAGADHPYLVRKDIPSMGAKVDDRGNLIIPVYTIRDFGIELLTSVERITPAGEKRFEAHCRMKAGYCFLNAEDIGRIPSPQPSRVWIAEGFATAATVAIATAEPGCCVFSAGNIIPAVETLAQHMTGTEFVIAADSDRQTPGNPGLQAALDTTKRLGWRATWPRFPEGVNGSDWNDLAAHCGVDAVREQLRGAIQAR